MCKMVYRIRMTVPNSTVGRSAIRAAGFTDIDWLGSFFSRECNEIQYWIQCIGDDLMVNYLKLSLKIDSVEIYNVIP